MPWVVPLRKIALVAWALVVFLLTWVAFFPSEYTSLNNPGASWSPDFSDQGHRKQESRYKQEQSICVNNDEESLCYIPHAVASVWAARELFVVLGIPSLDTETNHRRRYLQRTSWILFGGVATHRNNFTGDMLVLFVLARHHQHPHAYSSDLQSEAAKMQDVLTLPLNDARPATKKKSGSGGYWGTEAEIGVSRKSIMWYSIALRLFPHATHIAKADDDVFIRTPQYIADLRSLPRAGLYWGRLMKWSARKGDPRETFYFVGGMCITMSRDIVHHITSYAPLQRLLSMPYREENRNEFKTLNMDHEDVMLGRVLYETRHRDVIYVKENVCRFHDVHVGLNKASVTKRSLVVHHLHESEYASFAQRLLKDNTLCAPSSFARQPVPTSRVGKAMYAYLC